MDILSSLLFCTEAVGVVAFAISGAGVAIEKDLDLFGIIVLGVTTATGGGVIRDLLLGVTPPAMFQDPVYAEMAFVTALTMFVLGRFGTPALKRHSAAFHAVVELCDAVGLGVFAVTGVYAAQAAGYRENGFLAVFVGVVTGIGGGILRDIMAGEIPFVLNKRIYALAAIMGALCYYWMERKGISGAMFWGILLTVLIRVLAEHYGWQLPKARPREKKQEERT